MDPIVRLLQGKVGPNPHPLHVTLVHFPIGLLATSFSLDLFHLLQTHPRVPLGLRTLLTPTIRGLASGPSLLPHPSLTRQLAGWMLSIGLLTALPTILTGLAELYDLYRIHAKLQQNGKVAPMIVDSAARRLKLTFKHATMMDITFLAAAYNWYQARAYEPAMAILPTAHIVLSSIGLLTMFYGAYLGGDLVYTEGVGIKRQGYAARPRFRTVQADAPNVADDIAIETAAAENDQKSK